MEVGWGRDGVLNFCSPCMFTHPAKERGKERERPFFLGLSTRCAPVYTLSIIDVVLWCTLLEQKKGLIGSMVYSTDASKLDLCPLTGILSNAREIEAHDPSSLPDTANSDPGAKTIQVRLY